MSRSATLYCYKETPLIVVANGFDHREQLRQKQFKWAPGGVPGAIDPKSWIYLSQTCDAAKTTAKQLRAQLGIKNRVRRDVIRPAGRDVEIIVECIGTMFSRKQA